MFHEPLPASSIATVGRGYYLDISGHKRDSRAEVEYAWVRDIFVNFRCVLQLLDAAKHCFVETINCKCINN